MARRASTKCFVNPWKTSCYAYKTSTVRDLVIGKVFALAREEVSILEEKKEGARAVGTLPAGGLAYVITDCGSGWTYVESGDVRGFVRKDSLQTGSSASKAVKAAGEASFSQASSQVIPADNKALYYSPFSVKEGKRSGDIRRALIAKALTCLGHPYVWGGTSLTNGADCSGFVQTLFGLFPRTATSTMWPSTRAMTRPSKPSPPPMASFPTMWGTEALSGPPGSSTIDACWRSILNIF